MALRDVRIRHYARVSRCAARRWRRGERLTEAHRSHLYQRLANGPLGHTSVTIIYAAVALFFTARLPFVMFMPFPFGALETQSAWVAALVFGLDIAALLLTTFTIIGLRDEERAMNVT